MTSTSLLDHSLTLGNPAAAVVRTLSQPCEESHMVRNWGLQPTAVGAILEGDPPALVKPLTKLANSNNQ